MQRIEIEAPTIALAAARAQLKLTDRSEHDRMNSSEAQHMFTREIHADLIENGLCANSTVIPNEPHVVTHRRDDSEAKRSLRLGTFNEIRRVLRPLAPLIDTMPIRSILVLADRAQRRQPDHIDCTALIVNEVASIPMWKTPTGRHDAFLS
jgi:hypothetical protein